MAKPASGRWAEIRERTVNTPELKEQYERTKGQVMLIRHILMQIDAERVRAGISKAELARRVGTSPSVVRRIFSSKSGNPTMRTVLDMLDVLGMEIELKPPRESGQETATRGKHHEQAKKGEAT